MIRHIVLMCAALCATPLVWADTDTVNDPVEPMNRAFYRFNDGLDKVALKPAAKAYVAVVPYSGRVAFSNFANNFGDLPSAVNDLLQGKVAEALSDAGRFLINTTLGIGGAIDVASEMGLEKRNEDFGQTLGVWGLGSGPYLVLPFLGPSTVRDVSALPVDYALGARHLLIERVAVRNSIAVMTVVDRRASLLGAEDALDEAALDQYAFLRNFYLQRRQSQIYDGNPPRKAEERFDEDEPGPEPLPGEKK